MKNKLTLNLGLKLISVLFAFALWLIVVNVDDPMTTKQFKDITVNILNEELDLIDKKIAEFIVPRSL